MTKQSKSSGVPDRTIELAIQALIAEYHAMRDASLSRDARKGALENSMMIVFSAAIVGLLTIISQQQYILLPVLSLLSSALALAHFYQDRLLNDLALYEVKCSNHNL